MSPLRTASGNTMASKQTINAKPKCSQCGIPIGRAFDLGRHMKERHGPPEVCPECGHETHRKYRMNNHRRKKHGYPLDTVPLSMPQSFDMQQIPHGMSVNDSFSPRADTSTSSQTDMQFVPQSRDREYLQQMNISQNDLPSSKVPLPAVGYKYASGASQDTTFRNFQAQDNNSMSMAPSFQPLSGFEFMSYPNSQPSMDFVNPQEDQVLSNYSIPPSSMTGLSMALSIPASQNSPGSVYASYQGNYQTLQSDTSSANSGANYNSIGASQTPCSCCGRLDHQRL